MTLLSKLAAAKEGARELDARIAIEIGWRPDWLRDSKGVFELDLSDKLGPVLRWQAAGMRRTKWGPSEREFPRWTESVDAALSLVPEGWTVASIGQNDDKTWHVELREGYRTSYNRVVIAPDNYKAATPALALATAAMKARGDE